MAPNTPNASPASYARIAGLLLLLSLVAGAFGELYAGSQILAPGDAAATARNMSTSASLFRLGFASYLVEAVCDIALSMIFYVLLRPLNKNLALLAAFFGLVSTVLYGVAELFYFAPSLILGGADYLKAFSPDQLNTLALLSLNVFVYAAGIFTVFYGMAWIIRGYLMVWSGYFPKFVGWLMVLGGIGFVARNLALVLAPAFPSTFLTALIFPGIVSLTVWLLARGISAPKWEERAATA